MRLFLICSIESTFPKIPHESEIICAKGGGGGFEQTSGSATVLEYLLFLNSNITTVHVEIVNTLN